MIILLTGKGGLQMKGTMRTRELDVFKKHCFKVVVWVCVGEGEFVLK